MEIVLFFFLSPLYFGANEPIVSFSYLAQLLLANWKVERKKERKSIKVAENHLFSLLLNKRQTVFLDVDNSIIRFCYKFSCSKRWKVKSISTPHYLLNTQLLSCLHLKVLTRGIIMIKKKMYMFSLIQVV